MVCLQCRFCFSFSHRFIFDVRSEAVVRRYSVKNVFLEILQNSEQNTCARVSFLIKLPAPFIIEHIWRLLLYVLLKLQLHLCALRLWFFY